jgi:hypothetical protein
MGSGHSVRSPNTTNNDITEEQTNGTTENTETDFNAGPNSSTFIINSTNVSVSDSSQLEIPTQLRSLLTPLNFSTPEASPRSCRAYTPVGEDAAIYCYYCPLCMQYYKDMMKSMCCGHHICNTCCKDYLKGKGVSMKTFLNKSFTGNSWSTIVCPNCSTVGFSAKEVEANESHRDYARTPLQEMSSRSARRRLVQGHGDNSPLRAGDDFETLKRKMVPFQLNTTDSATTDMDNSGVGIAQVLDEDLMRGGDMGPRYVTAQAEILVSSSSPIRSARAGQGVGGGGRGPEEDGEIEQGVVVDVSFGVEDDIFIITPFQSPLKQQASTIVEEVFGIALSRFLVH